MSPSGDTPPKNHMGGTMCVDGSDRRKAVGPCAVATHDDPRPMTRNTDADDTTDADGEIERLIEADADGAGVDQ